MQACACFSAVQGPEVEVKEEPLSSPLDHIPDPTAPPPAQPEPLQSVDTAGLLEATRPMPNNHSEISSASPILTMQHSQTNESPLPTGEYIKVTVKEGGRMETMNALGIKTSYVQYTVHTDSTVPGLIAQGLEVKRRFSDFEVSVQRKSIQYLAVICVATDSMQVHMRVLSLYCVKL